MADNKTELPEGTDRSSPAHPTKIGAPTTDGDSDRMTRTDSAATDRPRRRIAERCAAAARRFGQAADKARGLVTQGLERTAEALANVSQDGRRHRRRDR